MNITEAQREVRTVFLGGFAGQLVSGIVWLVSAALSQWLNPRYGMIFLFFGGMIIFPATQLVLRVMGRTTKLSPGNSLNQLATQIAFTVPIGFLLVGAATLAKLDWFYPAAMVVVGAHYLPFCFLYGMWQFALLAGLMIGGGALLALYLPLGFTAGGWITSLLLFLAAIIGPIIVRSESGKLLK
jgi:hypothetical protein